MRTTHYVGDEEGEHKRQKEKWRKQSKNPVERKGTQTNKRTITSKRHNKEFVEKNDFFFFGS